MSTEIAASISDPSARIELRTVQPDPLDSWTTNELWGVNLSDQPVCGGYRSGESWWTAFPIAPRSERRLIGLGNGAFSGMTRIRSLPSGQACTDGYIAMDL